MSPFPALPEPSEPESSDPVDVPRLHLVAPHEHAWHLRAVDYDEGLEVRRYECAECGDILFR